MATTRLQLLACSVLTLALTPKALAFQPVPLEVRALAHVFVKASRPTLPSQEATLREDFIRGFSSGFMEPGFPETADQGPDRPAFAAGHRRGVEYAQAGGPISERIWAGFGYHPVRLRGDWFLGFETSVFRFGGLKSCWLRPQRHAVVGVDAATESQRPRPIKVQVVGYMSPRGEHGHLGMSTCEIIATAVSPDA